MSQIDKNYQVVGLVITDNAAETIVPLLCDPVTDRLLIDLTIGDVIVDVSAPTKIDQNYEGVSMAVTDDTAQTIVPLKVIPLTNKLVIDLLVE
jgi:hypothetical protein